MGKRGNLYRLDWPRDRRIIERTIPFYPRAGKRQDEVGDDPAFLPAVCHCLEQAVARGYSITRRNERRGLNRRVRRT
jgi:hypothetical protein